LAPVRLIPGGSTVIEPFVIEKETPTIKEHKVVREVHLQAWRGTRLCWGKWEILTREQREYGGKDKNLNT